ncbi:single-stranded DNA-binding protein [Patescibacteria group bacterium]
MASRSLNKVMLIGNLTRDPELRYTPSGTAVCTFGLATNRSWTPSDGGERQEEAEFHRIVAWQKLAELCAQLLFKGRKAFVEGRLQTRTWTGKDGKERTTTEIVIDNMIILDTKRREGDEGGSYSPQSPPQVGKTDDNSDTSVGKDDKVKEEKAKKPVADKVSKTSSKNKAENKKTAKTAKPEGDEEVKADDIPF